MDNVLTGLTVFLTEDETMVSMLIEDMLQELGATKVIHAASRAAALDALGRAAPALAVLDVNLGGETSYPVAAELHRRGIPFIFVTGYGRGGVDEAWADRAVLQKPMNLQMLAAAVREALAPK